VLFPTVTFAAFFMAVWPLVWAVARWPRLRQVVLLLSSVAFYAWWDWRMLWLLAALVVGNHGAAWAVHRLASHPAARRAALWVGVAGHLLVLGWYKYYGFFATSLTGALDRVGVQVQPPLVQVVLPLGISFVTFQAISHLVEVHREVTGPATLLETATWLCFFPTVASGPITRVSELVPQLRERPEPRVDASRAFVLILRGLVKKLVLASYLADAVVDDVFAQPSLHSGPEVLAGIYAYAVQLYVDFSGYTDLAIGVALLLGIRLPENFDAPYRAATVTEFWNRWHMTLSRWLRDFLFMPLARRSRPTTAAVARNLVVVMLLAGLWHGAAWTFVAFGAVHGVAMALERVARERARRRGRRPVPTGPARVVGVVRTFHVVCLGWVFFRADSLAGAVDVLSRLGTGWGAAAPLVTWLLVATIAAVLAAQLVPERARDGLATVAARVPTPLVVPLAAAAILVVDVLAPPGVAPFLYFGF
jgi:D-alanyl-lipoteichoic acid acyltransferase DltB (MBOAT superfamily)